MKRPLAYITAACSGDYDNDTEQATEYCRAVYEAGFSPLCPMLYLPLFLNDEIPEEHKSGIDMSRDLLRRAHVLTKKGDKKDVTVLDTRCYNGLGQLVSVCRDLVVTAYAYRPDNLRHSKTTDGVETVHYWDGQNMVLEANGKGFTKATYLRGINLITQVIDLSLFYYLFNAHGDVVQRVAHQGHATPLYEYDSFGNLRERPELYDPDKDPNPFRYCGEYWDADIEEVYLRARSYNPTNGRFASEDPARSGEHWYTYCYNAPIKFIDPTGLEIILEGNSEEQELLFNALQ